MLKALKVKIPDGELRYLVKARDKFLAHPIFRGRVRNAHGMMTIPATGLFHPHAINVYEGDPILMKYYSSSFGVKCEADEERLRHENEKLILSTKKNSEFSPDEHLRLKAFGIREPDLGASLRELAMLLLSSALPQIQLIAAQPLPLTR